MKQYTYVTCSVCKHRYIGVIPKGGDGSVLFPRKHFRTIPTVTYLGMTVKKGRKEYCPGIRLEPEEYEEK